MSDLKPWLWKPGQCPNPHGRPKISEDVRKLRELTKNSVKKIMDLVATGNKSELEQIQKDPQSTVLELWLTAAALKGIRSGSMSDLETILQRSIGKVKDELDVNLPTPMAITKFSDKSQVILCTDQHTEKDFEDLKEKKD